MNLSGANDRREMGSLLHALTEYIDGKPLPEDETTRALIGQATGEDWRDVALTLSTASPQQWTELPELAALKIGRAQPAPAKTGWRPPPLGAGELYADYDRELGAKSMEELRPRSPAPPASRGSSRPTPTRRRCAACCATTCCREWPVDPACTARC